MKTIVPDYYASFQCKIDQCRTACCDGWPVTFSMKDYFSLLSADCSAALKRKLDMSLHLTRHPTEAEYGMFLPRYDGRCPIRLSDGRCALQAEAGEAALPAVCRQYPRSLRPGEASCANSCEAVIELLDREAPIRFLTIDREETAAIPRTHFFETDGREMEIRLWLIGIVQDRKMPMPSRLARLDAAIRRLDDALNAHASDTVGRLLTGNIVIEMPALSGDRPAGLYIVKRLLESLNDLSESIREYGEMALKHFEGEGALSEDVILARLRQASPRWEAWFENMLVNHMFFSQFPFQDRPVSLTEEVVALYAVYALLRFLSIGAGNGTRERQADIGAALFRLVDHTAFDRYAVPILKAMGSDEKALLMV